MARSEGTFADGPCSHLNSKQLETTARKSCGLCSMGTVLPKKRIGTEELNLLIRLLAIPVLDESPSEKFKNEEYSVYIRSHIEDASVVLKLPDNGSLPIFVGEAFKRVMKITEGDVAIGFEVQPENGLRLEFQFYTSYYCGKEAFKSDFMSDFGKFAIVSFSTDVMDILEPVFSSGAAAKREETISLFLPAGEGVYTRKEKFPGKVND